METGEINLSVNLVVLFVLEQWVVVSCLPELNEGFKSERSDN